MIDTEEYRSWDATEMAELVARGEVHPAELREACMTLVAELNPSINAIGDVRGEPGEFDEVGSPAGRFAGVPMGFKEVLGVPGFPHTFGSRVFAQNVATESSPYVDRLVSSGVQLLFSTTSSEFGLLGSTESWLRGPTTNPWRAGLSAAGSSGGSAAVVAAGIVPIAHGSDAGGSIRGPASVTGLFGFKPSNGRCAPSMPDAPGLSALLVDHVLTRSVRDSAAMLSVTERTGPDASYPPIGDITTPSERRLRVGVVEATLVGGRPPAAISDELRRAAELLESLGHHVSEIPTLPVDGAGLSDAFFLTAGLTINAVADMVTPMLGRPPGPDELEPFTLELMEWTRGLPTTAPGAANDTLDEASASYRRLFDRFDVIVSPTLSSVPWEIGHLAPDVGRAELIARTEAAVGYTPIHNVTGSPAMSVPLATVDGLPVGIHAAAAPGEDALLLGLAHELEAARPWHDRRPDLAALRAVG